MQDNTTQNNTSYRKAFLASIPKGSTELPMASKIIIDDAIRDMNLLTGFQHAQLLLEKMTDEEYCNYLAPEFNAFISYIQRPEIGMKFSIFTFSLIKSISNGIAGFTSAKDTAQRALYIAETLESLEKMFKIIKGSRKNGDQ